MLVPSLVAISILHFAPQPGADQGRAADKHMRQWEASVFIPYFVPQKDGHSNRWCTCRTAITSACPIHSPWNLDWQQQSSICARRACLNNAPFAASHPIVATSESGCVTAAHNQSFEYKRPGFFFPLHLRMMLTLEGPDAYPSQSTSHLEPDWGCSPDPGRRSWYWRPDSVMV